MSEEGQQYIRWFHVYGKLCCEPYTTLINAVLEAEYSSEAGNSSEGHIEGPDGIVPNSEIRALVEAYRAEQQAKRATQPKPAPIVAQLQVREPVEGNEADRWKPGWAEYDSYRESQLDVLEREKAELIGMLGAERVRVAHFNV